MAESVDNLILEQLPHIRREIADVRTLALQNADYTRRLDRRMSELRDDIELMIKAELMGRLGHFETTIEQRLEAMADRIAALEPHSPR